jgi:hypothetical protein
VGAEGFTYLRSERGAEGARKDGGVSQQAVEFQENEFRYGDVFTVLQGLEKGGGGGMGLAACFDGGQ